MLSTGIAGPKHQPKPIINYHSNGAGVGREQEAYGLNKVNPTLCKVRGFRLILNDKMCPLALFWHLVKEKPLVKIVLALQLNEL